MDPQLMRRGTNSWGLAAELQLVVRAPVVFPCVPKQPSVIWEPKFGAR